MKKYIIAAALMLALIVTSCGGNSAGNDSGISAGSTNNGDNSKIRAMSNPYEELASGYTVEEALSCLKLSNVPITLYAEEFSASGADYMEAFFEKVRSGKRTEITCAKYFELKKDSMTEEAYEREEDDYPCLFISKIAFNGNTFEVSTRGISGDKSKKEVEQDNSEEPGKSTEQNTDIDKREYKYIRKYSEVESTGEGLSSMLNFANQRDEYVLLNEEVLTWGEIMRGVLSSQSSDYIDHFVVFSEPARMQIKGGEYQSGKIENAEKWSMVQFDGDDFRFSPHIAISYTPSGSFEIVGEEITLIGRGEDEVFTIKILNGDELKLTDFPQRYEKILEKGTIYSYIDKKK